MDTLFKQPAKSAASATKINGTSQKTVRDENRSYLRRSLFGRALLWLILILCRALGRSVERPPKPLAYIFAARPSAVRSA